MGNWEIITEHLTMYMITTINIITIIIIIVIRLLCTVDNPFHFF